MPSCGSIVIVKNKNALEGTHAVRIAPECTMPDWQHIGTTWPASTKILCWHCAHTFDTPPIPMPVCYNERTDIFKVRGNFCSWNCLKAYSRDNTPAHTSRGIDANIIALFYKRITGRMARIVAAPPRFMMSEFGGLLSLDEFRSKSETLAYDVMPPKMVPLCLVVSEQRAGEIRRHAALPSQDLSESVDLGTSTAPIETLRLRRPKPKKQIQQSLLEKTLGLNFAS